MTSVDVRQLIEVQATALGPVLHEGTATSLSGALKRSKGLPHREHPHLRPLLMRAEMRKFLDSRRMPDGWQVGGDSRLMGQLHLVHAEHNLEMRFLKERRRTYPGGVPLAGKNHARRERWTAPPLDFDLPISTSTGPVPLLLLWDFLNAQTLDQFTLRIVHTLAPGVYGQEVPCDLILDVDHGGDIFKRLSFSGSPENEDLFAGTVRIDEVEDSGT
jgi:hypothetical protein